MRKDKSKHSKKPHVHYENSHDNLEDNEKKDFEDSSESHNQPSDVILEPSANTNDDESFRINNHQQQLIEQDEGDKHKRATVAVPHEDVHSDLVNDWIKCLTRIKIFFILFGQWPYSYTESKKGYVFKFNWKTVGFYLYIWTCLFNLYGLLASGINVIDILMKDKLRPKVAQRSKTEVIEQGLVERHTMIVIIILGSYGINLFTLLLILSKRNDTADTFSKWTHFLEVSKLDPISPGTLSYALVAFLNFCVVSIVLIVFTVRRTSATFIGGPTVISILFMRHFISADYLDKDFSTTGLHSFMHGLGVFLYFYVSLTTNMTLYMFLWFLKSIQNAINSWNDRLIDAMETFHENDNPEEDIMDEEPKPRESFSKLYADHIGLTRTMDWFNKMFAGILELWMLFFTVRIVWQIYLAALVIEGNGKPLNKARLGKYFMRKRDYLPALVISYENIFMVVITVLASSWLEDAAYDSYDEIREVSLLKGPSNIKESFFMLSMFQSYTSTTKLAVYGSDYFCIDRYTVLHVFSAIMSNFLVVYQFRPLFDTDTTEFPEIRQIFGNFLISFEGLPENHTLEVSDIVRNKATS